MAMNFDPVGENDTTKHRVIEMTDGNKIHFRSRDPFGFWKISLDKGQLPPRLQGEYTTFSEAEKAALSWMDDKRKEVSRVVQTVGEARA